MNFKQKKLHGADYLNQIKAQKSDEDIYTHFINKGVSKFDVVKIKKAAINALKEEYGIKVKTYLLEQNLEEHLDEFDLVDAELFEEIQKEQLEKIIAESNAVVSRLVKEDFTEEEIFKKVINPYYNEDNVREQINKYKYLNEPISGSQKLYYKYLGAALTVLAVIIMILGRDSSWVSLKPIFLTVTGLLFLLSKPTQHEIDIKKRNVFKFYKDNDQG